MNYMYVGGKGYKTPCSWMSDAETKIETDSASARREVRDPEKTLLFTDTATLANTGDFVTPLYDQVGEYSFAESNYWTNASNEENWDGLPDLKPGYGPEAIDLNRSVSPSVHFRHAGRTNVVWCDGHVSGESNMFSRVIDVYGTDVDYPAYNIGWFGGDDNTVFALDKKNLEYIPVTP